MAEVRAGTTGGSPARREPARPGSSTRADLVILGPLRLHAAVLRKDGDRLSGEATVSEAELAAALPSQLRLRPVEDPPAS